MIHKRCAHCGMAIMDWANLNRTSVEFMPKKGSDLSGRRFGLLTALYPTERRDSGGTVMWYCACDCGGEIYASRERLLAQKIKSCGCLLKKAQANITNILTRVDGTCIEYLSRKNSRNNTSGYTGVHRTENGRWRAVIGFMGKTYNLGTYRNVKDAATAYDWAKETLHGRFIRRYHQLTASGESVRALTQQTEEIIRDFTNELERRRQDGGS